MNRVETTIVENGDTTTRLMIGGSMFDYPNDYLPLANSIEGTNIIVNNPFHATRERPENWEAELRGMYGDVAKKYGCEEVLAHSVGTLHAGNLAIELNAQGIHSQIQRLILLHPPVGQCPQRDDIRRVPSAKDELAMLDVLVAQTSAGLTDEMYADFLKRHSQSYASSRLRLVGILKYDLRGVKPEAVQSKLTEIEDKSAADIFAVAGDKDPWNSPILTDRKKTLHTFPGAGHWTHLSHTEKLAELIERWRVKSTYAPAPRSTAAVVQKEPSSNGF